MQYHSSHRNKSRIEMFFLCFFFYVLIFIIDSLWFFLFTDDFLLTIIKFSNFYGWNLGTCSAVFFITVAFAELLTEMSNFVDI